MAAAGKSPFRYAQPCKVVISISAIRLISPFVICGTALSSAPNRSAKNARMLRRPGSTLVLDSRGAGGAPIACVEAVRFVLVVLLRYGRIAACDLRPTLVCLLPTVGREAGSTVATVRMRCGASIFAFG